MLGVDDCLRLVLLFEMPAFMANTFKRNTICFWQDEVSKKTSQETKVRQL